MEKDLAWFDRGVTIGSGDIVGPVKVILVFGSILGGMGRLGFVSVHIVFCLISTSRLKGKLASDANVDKGHVQDLRQGFLETRKAPS